MCPRPVKRRGSVRAAAGYTYDITEHGMHDAAHIAAERARYAGAYLARWERMLAGWERPARPAMGWLMYAANYLFVTHGVRWAVDPLRPNLRVRDLPTPVPTAPLAQLDFVLLTHDHGDHVDLPLLATLRGTTTRLVVPEALLDRVRAGAQPDERQLIVARPGERLDLAGVGVLPFTGWHYDTLPNGQRTGVPATGYAVTVGGERWLFPGDVRDYTAASLAPFAPADRLFAHLWLGRGAAELPTPPLGDAFCRFLLTAAPRAVVLTHLYEFSRPPSDLWSRRHAAWVQARWAALAGGVPLLVPELGEEIAR